MALVRVAQYNSTPTVVGDYQAQNAHLQAFTNQLLTQQFILDAGTDQPVIKQGCYVSHGGSLYVADADTAITGSPSDGSVYIRVSGSTSLTVEFVNNISGYTWNPVYSALTSGSYTLLPYLIVKASTVWTRYNFNPNNQSFGAIIGASIDTGQGATEVHLMNQNLRTTDSPTFATINTGHGANELYPMNQAVRTTDSPTFNTIGFTSLNPDNSVETSIQLSAESSYILPNGAYAIKSGSTVTCQMKHGSDWVILFRSNIFIISDGVNFRLFNDSSSESVTANIRKW